MEFVLVLIVIIVLCKVLGISNEFLVIGGLALIELTIIAMLLFFVYFCLHLLFTKRKKASFTRSGKPENSKFQVAYYLVDGKEYPCIFPKEAGLNYRKERHYNVYFSRKLKKVYDIWAVLTCIIGLFLSAAAVYFSLKIISFASAL